MQILNLSKPSEFILDVLFRSLFMYVGHENYPTFNRCAVVIQNKWHNEDVNDTLTSRSLDIRIFRIRAFDAIIRLLRCYGPIVCPCITMLVKMLGEARPNHLPVFWKPRPLLLTAPPKATEQSI